MYIPFTDEQKLRAAQVDLPSFLSRQGVELKRAGNEYRLAADPYITIRGSRWYDQAEQHGGNAVSLARKLYGLSYPEAVTMLLEGGAGQLSILERKPVTAVNEKKEFALPPPHTNMRRVYVYLIKQRCIPAEVITHFAKAGALYESAELQKDSGKIHHNAIFVGHDENGAARHAHKHGLGSAGDSFKGNVGGSNPAYSFRHIGESKHVFVFEAPIDMMSYIVLHPDDWQRHSYVALCGMAEHALLCFLAGNPHINKISLCLDNDRRGQEGAARLQNILHEKGYYNIETMLPQAKDWNEVLVNTSQTHVDMAAADETKMESVGGMQFL